ncbi:MAG: hypothetical protein Q7W30_09130 [Coriobacteriia bacterium]|nr:hypothetical protein [Coriobacteriia bacterium]
MKSNPVPAWVVVAITLAVAAISATAFLFWQRSVVAGQTAELAAIRQSKAELDQRIADLEAQVVGAAAVASQPVSPAEPQPGTATGGATKPAPKPQPVNKRVLCSIKVVDPTDPVPANNWEKVRFSIDEMTYLTGTAAKAWLDSKGQGASYASGYWYAKNVSTALKSYVADDPDAVSVVMYTYPTAPAQSPYWPDHLLKQPASLQDFYTWAYDEGKADQLLKQRLYWMTIKNGSVVKVEEQPRDPYYEP